MNLKNLSGYFVLAFILILGSTFVVYPAIRQISGLAVAQSSTRWNNVQDAAAGDNLTNGLMAMSLYLFDGTNFDRARGDTTNGLDVDVIRFPDNEPFNIAQMNGVTVTMGNGVAGTGVQRVTIASDSTGTLTPPTVGAAFFAIDRDNIAQSSVNIAFGLTSEKVAVEAPSANGADICIDWDGGTAACPSANTAGNMRLAPGTTVIIDDIAITSVSVIAASGTQTFSVTAWN